MRNPSRWLPAARVSTPAELLTGKYDQQWVEVEDLVRSVSFLDGHHVLRLGTSNRFSVYIPAAQGQLSSSNYVEATVRVRGVCAGNLGVNNQRDGFRIFAPGIEEVRVLVPPQVAVANLPVSSVADLRAKIQASRQPPWKTQTVLATRRQ